MSENFGSEERDELVVKLRNRITELEAQLDDGRRTVKECHELAAKRISELERAIDLALLWMEIPAHVIDNIKTVRGDI